MLMIVDNPDVILQLIEDRRVAFERDAVLWRSATRLVRSRAPRWWRRSRRQPSAAPVVALPAPPVVAAAGIEDAA